MILNSGCDVMCGDQSAGAKSIMNSHIELFENMTLSWSKYMDTWGKDTD